MEIKNKKQENKLKKNAQTKQNEIKSLQIHHSIHFVLDNSSWAWSQSCILVNKPNGSLLEKTEVSFVTGKQLQISSWLGVEAHVLSSGTPSDLNLQGSVDVATVLLSLYMYPSSCVYRCYFLRVPLALQSFYLLHINSWTLRGGFDEDSPFSNEWS